MAITRYEPDRATFDALLEGEPRYRVDQVWNGLYQQLADFSDISNLPATLRTRLDAELPSALTPVTESLSDDGQTAKWLFRLGDGATIETVLMHYPERSTVCVSCQAGCAMGCTFCATGQAGFTRHLTSGEIVEQVIVAAVARAARVGACRTWCSWGWASRSPTSTGSGQPCCASMTTSDSRPGT